ncbi:hypothetical protein [Plantactinospora sp. B24E8]|uniref:hypothetical protein n=1 Tax=Plantactinospora sp. B24E8 TaxID=3153567 RepID=UPI00325D09AB
MNFSGWRRVRRAVTLLAAGVLVTGSAATAAPHAAALVLSGNPGLTNAELRTAMTRTALDLGPAGPDARSGHGVIRADLLLKQTGATPQPLVRTGEPTVTPTRGDGDQYLEAGERAMVSLPAVNVGDARATGVSVTLSSDDPRVTVTASRPYGAIAAGAGKSKDFTVTLAKDYPVGRPVMLNAKVTFAGALSPTTGRPSVATGQPSDSARTFSYDGPALPIPDGSQEGVSATVDVSDVGFAAGMTFSVDGTECSADPESTTAGISHGYVYDLFGSLTAPDGATALLFLGIGGSGKNLCQVVFDDNAGTRITSATFSQAPFTGSWRPIEPLAPLLASPADGRWTFFVSDAIPGGSGTLRSFSLHFTRYVS